MSSSGGGDTVDDAQMTEAPAIAPTAPTTEAPAATPGGVGRDRAETNMGTSGASALSSAAVVTTLLTGGLALGGMLV